MREMTPERRAGLDAERVQHAANKALISDLTHDITRLCEAAAACGIVKRSRDRVLLLIRKASRSIIPEEIVSYPQTERFYWTSCQSQLATAIFELDRARVRVDILCLSPDDKEFIDHLRTAEEWASGAINSATGRDWDP